MPLCKTDPYIKRRCLQDLTSLCVIISQCGYFTELLGLAAVNPILTRGQIMPNTVLRAPQDFQTLRRPCSLEYEVISESVSSYPELTKSRVFTICSSESLNLSHDYYEQHHVY